jgi:hypothetical protein
MATNSRRRVDSWARAPGDTAPHADVAYACATDKPACALVPVEDLFLMGMLTPSASIDEFWSGRTRGGCGATRPDTRCPGSRTCTALGLDSTVARTGLGSRVKYVTQIALIVSQLAQSPTQQRTETTGRATIPRTRVPPSGWPAAGGPGPRSP